MKYTEKITLELNCGTTKPVLAAKQGDSGARQFAVTLTENGAPYPIPERTRAELRIQKPDGYIVTGGCTIRNNTIYAELSTQALAASGTAYGDIRLYSDSNEVLSSIPFALKILPEPVGDEDIASDSEFRAQLGGLTFEHISRQEFDALESRDPQKVYYVVSGTKIQQYLGDVELSSGNITSGTITLNTVGSTAITGTTETEE